MDLRDASKPILLLSLLFTACVGHVPGNIIGPLDSKLNGYQSTVSTEVITEIYYVTDQPTTQSTSSISTGTTGTPLLDPTLPPSSESPSQTTTTVFATLTRPTRSTKTISILTSLQKTTVSPTGSYSPFTSTTKNPPFQATSEHFSTGDSKFTSPSHGHTNLFVTSSSLASTHQSGTSSRMMTTLARSNQSHSMLPKTESMRTTFPRTEDLRTEPPMRNGNPHVTEEPSVWHNPTFVALFSFAVSIVFLLLIMLIICCIICHQMKDASKREDAYNQRFTLLQMHALRRVGPSPGALPKSEIEMGYVSEQNWDDKEVERPGIPIIAWL